MLKIKFELFYPEQFPNTWSIFASFPIPIYKTKTLIYLRCKAAKLMRNCLNVIIIIRAFHRCALIAICSNRFLKKFMTLGIFGTSSRKPKPSYILCKCPLLYYLHEFLKSAFALCLMTFGAIFASQKIYVYCPFNGKCEVFDLRSSVFDLRFIDTLRKRLQPSHLLNFTNDYKHWLSSNISEKGSLTP